MLDSRKPYLARNMLYNKLDFCNINENGTGKLEISVYHEDFKEPLSNATIKIYKVTVSGVYNENGEGKLVYNFTTDSNGKVIVDLPAVNELMPDNNDFYYIVVNHPTHYSAHIFNAEIYPDIATQFDVSLKFIYTNEEHFQFMMQPRRSDIVAPQQV